MFNLFHVALHERAVVLENGLPREALAPGRHFRLGFGRTLTKFDTRRLVLDAPTAIRAALPADWFAEVRIGTHERGLIYKDGVPRAFVRPGSLRYWTVDPSVELVVLSIDEAMPELTDELQVVIPRGDYVDVMVHAHEKGLHYVQGRLAGVLEPGHYTLWTHPGSKVEVRTVDMRSTQLLLQPQELMTRDKVTLRLSLSADYAIADPEVATHRLASVRDAVYLVVQLAARDYVAGVTLDELLEGRDAMTRALEAAAVPQARAFGVTLERVGVKDVVLPGEMKTLLNRVIEAEKEAAANVILRREETAAMRSLANTARVMADNPVLLRLKELESLKDIAEKIGEVRLFMGADGFDTLLPAGLLAARRVETDEQ
jgi:regulator of protease activity HflC (stomatin/prohibitin superfamily)